MVEGRWAVMLDVKQRKRLVALLGMTGSCADGEALVATRKASEFLKSLKLTWEEVIVGDKRTEVQTKELHHTHMAKWLVKNAGNRMSDKEYHFVMQMVDWKFPTAKQLDWLDRIFVNYGGRGDDPPF